MKIKSLFILLFLSVFTFAHAQLTDYSIFDKKFNFYVANDLGRNGYYDQKPIAELIDRKSTRLNSSHDRQSRMPSSA